MPSEKSRYRNRNRGPTVPLEFEDLRAHLRSFEHERLSELLLLRAETDVVLWKAPMASVSMQLAHGDWNKTKEAIDYALHFEDYVRYTDCHYGIVLYEMIKTLEILGGRVNEEFVIRAAQYILDRGQQVTENFEDDWDWISSLEVLEKWIQNKTPSLCE